jgi:hypothetical protein
MLHISDILYTYVKYSIKHVSLLLRASTIDVDYQKLLKTNIKSFARIWILFSKKIFFT